MKVAHQVSRLIQISRCCSSNGTTIYNWTMLLMKVICVAGVSQFSNLRTGEMMIRRVDKMRRDPSKKRGRKTSNSHASSQIARTLSAPKHARSKKSCMSFTRRGVIGWFERESINRVPNRIDDCDDCVWHCYLEIWSRELDTLELNWFTPHHNFQVIWSDDVVRKRLWSSQIALFESRHYELIWSHLVLIN